MKKIFLTLLITLSFAQANDIKDISIQLKWKYQFQFAGFIMAQEKGFYKDVGFNVELKELESDTSITSDVVHRKSDFGVSDSSLVYDALHGKDVVAIMAVFQHSPFILLGLKHNQLNKLQDLHNKKMALYEGIDGISIKTMLKSNSINYIPKPPIFSLDKLLSGEVDFMSAYVSNEPYQAKLKKLDIITFAPKDYGFEGYGDIFFTSKKMLKDNPEDVKKMYTASYRGWEYAWSHIEETVDVIYKKYNTQNKTKDALLFEAHQLKELSGYGENLGEIEKEKIKSIAQLFNLVKNENNKLSILDHFIYKQQLFTAEESKYIQEKKSVKVCTHKNQDPFVIFEKDDYSGISVEYLKKFSQVSKLEFKIIPTDTLQNHLEMLKNGECDISAIVLTKPNSFDYLTPTNKIVSDNIVLVTKITEPYQGDLKTLGNKRISIQKGANNLIRYVKSIYPHINLVEITGNDISRVATGEFYGHIGASYQVSDKIAKDYSNELKIMSKIGDKKINGSFGVTNREPILLNILNKLINHIPTLEKQKIQNSWLSIKVEKEFDYTHFIQTLGVSLVIILTLLYFYFKQRKLKIEIENEKDKFENIFDAANDGLTILTNGIFTDCNAAVVKLLKCKDKGELLGLTPAQFSPKYQEDGNLSEEKAPMMMQLAIKNGFHNFQWLHKKRDGSEFWCDIMLTDISSDNSEQIIHALWRDVTKQKILESEILEINMHLEEKVQLEVEKNKQQQLLILQQNRLAQMGEMISLIAHQWRQPLNTLAILNLTIILKYKQNKLDDTLMDKFKINSGKQINQMSSTIDDFRNFFSPEKEKVNFSINEVIHHVLDILKPALESEKINITVQEQKNFSINGYQNELGQAILNIIANAKDALIENSIESKQIHISLQETENSITLYISDNAGGIPEKIIDKIFDPYFSTKTEKNGTGLGLYMSKMIINEHMDGTLRVRNTQNGAEFSIFF